MNNDSFTLSKYRAAIFLVLALPILYAISRYNYSLFHSLADGVSIVIAACFFVIIWNSRHLIDNDYFLYVGITFLFWALLDFMHLLGNKNMGVFPAYGNLGPAFYIASRYILSISLMIAPLFINRKLNTTLMFGVYSLITLLLLLSIFSWQIFPVCIVEGVGLTPFKVVSDYIICLILLGAMGLLFIRRRSFDSRVLWLIASSIILSIATGLSFTLYTDPFGIMNMVGHLFQIASFYLVYLAFIKTSLSKPQDILYRKLKQNEAALRESNAYLENLINYANAPIIVWDPQFRITRFNHAFEFLTGLSEAEVLGKSPELLFPTEHAGDSMALIRKTLTGERWETVEIKILHRDESVRTVLWNSATLFAPDGQTPIATIAQGQDITERNQAEADKENLEAQNRQLQKTESLGRMAGAIAHTFNNQLGVVIGNLEMAIEELPKGAGPVNSLTTATRAAWKAAEVSGKMLTYLGQSFDKRERLDLAEVCLRNLPFLKAAMPGTVVLETDLSSPGPAVIGNATEIQQVLTNLITNAWEAVGTSRGSIHLSVKTISTADIPQSNRFPIGWQPQGSAYACLEVTDTGAGIAHNDIEKLFDPFFTSKFTGRGLGLAMVVGIVKAHGGVVTVESAWHRGSAFRIFLPVSAEEVSPQTDKEATVPEITRGGTVLLVDDEEMLRDMAAAMLTRLGFTVLAAKDGIEALEQFRQHRDEIRLVLSDLTMPRMDGWETLTALRQLAPDLPVILASGFDKAQIIAGDHPELPHVFLGKPYKLKELGDAIGQALFSRKI